MIDFGLYATYALIGICIVMILLFAIGRIAKNPGGAKSALIGIVGLAVLVAVAFGLSTGSDVTEPVFAKMQITEETSRQVGAGLMVFYILAGLAILSILYVEVTRLFK
ncbi:MAG: hypothetical protein ACPF9D_04330 [Owenweeksia sp.]